MTLKYSIPEMAVVSKHARLEDILEGFTCKDVFHPWTSSCILSYLYHWKISYKGNLKFFLLVYVIQLIMNRGKINLEYLKHQVKNYIRSFAFGMVMSANYIGFGCIFRNLFGRFFQYNVAYLPAVVAGLSLVLEESRKQDFYVCSYFTLVTEYAVRQLLRAKVFEMTRAKICMWNMMCSAAVMYLLRTNEGKRLPSTANYWFYSPPDIGKFAEGNDCNQQSVLKCHHKGPCWKHGLKVANKYFTFGVTLQLLRTLVPLWDKILQKPVYVLQKLIARKNFYFGLFLSSYVIIYNAVICFLYQYDGQDFEWHSIPAGFLAGLAILFYPRLSMFLMTTTTILQQLIRRGIAKGLLPTSRLYQVIAFALCNGVLFHSRLVDNDDLCHPFVRKMIANCSGDRADEISGIYERAKINYLQIHQVTELQT